MFTSLLKNVSYKITLGFLTFLMCLGLISLFLNKADAACDPAAGPCPPETTECFDLTGTSIPCSPEEDGPNSECGDSRTNPCPEEECNPATEDCASGFGFEPGGGGEEECSDEAGASAPCPEEECDPATENCGNGFSFEPGGNQEECFDEAGATIPCEEEPNTPYLNPNDPNEPECFNADGSPAVCDEDDPGTPVFDPNDPGTPGCLNVAGVVVPCEEDEPECNPAAENCGNTLDFCDPVTEDCPNEIDFCDPQKDICDDFIPECDPTKEICGSVQLECTGENCGTDNRINTPKLEDTPQTFTINKAPNLRPAAPDSPNNAASTTTSAPPRLASTGPESLIFLLTPALAYFIYRKTEKRAIKKQ